MLLLFVVFLCAMFFFIQIFFDTQKNCTHTHTSIICPASITEDATSYEFLVVFNCLSVFVSRNGAHTHVVRHMCCTAIFTIRLNHRVCETGRARSLRARKFYFPQRNAIINVPNWCCTHSRTASPTTPNSYLFIYLCMHAACGLHVKCVDNFSQVICK